MSTLAAVISYNNTRTEPTSTTVTFPTAGASPSDTISYLLLAPLNGTGAYVVSADPVAASGVFIGHFTPITSLPASSTASKDASSSPTSSKSKATSPPTKTVNISSSQLATSSLRSATTGSVPQNTSSVLNSNASSLSSGVVAGVVIGAAIGLAALTFLLTFFCMRRRQRTTRTARNDPQKFEMDATAGLGAQNGSAGTTKKSGAKGANVSVARSAPSADDNTVRSKTRTLMDQIELFVENFYLDNASPQDHLLQNGLSVFDSPYLPKNLGILMMQSHQCSDLIKHVLAYSIFKRLTVGSDTQETFLPPEYALAPTNPEKNTHDPEVTRSLAQWRTLTMFLRPDAFHKASCVIQRNERIQRLSNQFLYAFSIWAQPKYTEKERRTSLESILKEAAEYGVFLFSQPSQIEFRWPSRSQLGSNRIAVLPALDKTTDERGNILASPQVLVEPNIKEI